MSRRARAVEVAAVLHAVMLMAAVATSEAAPITVGSGPLEARVGPKAWSLTLAGITGGGSLREYDVRGSGSLGPLGFADDGGWHHATRVRSVAGGRQRKRVVVATDDPASRRIEVTLTVRRRGVVDLRAEVVGAPGVTATGIGFAASGAERYLGFGERSNAVDQRGNEVENYVSDGPYPAAERPVIATYVPPQGFHPRDDATYFPIPWLLSTRGYGVLVGNDDRSIFKLGTEGAGGWSLEVDSPSLALSFVAGPDPADALRRASSMIGRQPPPAAPWFFGPWYQPHGPDSEIEQARALRDADVPGSAISTFLHYLPCGAQQGVEADQPPRTSAAHAAGYAITTYFNPMICESYSPVYDEAVARGLLTLEPSGAPVSYSYSASPTNPFLVGQFDFSNPAANEFYGGLLDEAVEDGYDGWMEDFGEYSPLDAVSADGTPGPAMHNRYPVLYHRASYEFARTQARGVAGYVRSGWTGSAAYSQLVWGGDPTVDFGFDGLSSAVKQALSIGTSGVSRWGSDIGGFFALARRLTPELLARWIELGAVSPLMRTQANGVSVPAQPDRPQVTDLDMLPIWRQYAKLHTQLYPYQLAADAAYRRSGMPAMRHLALVYPGDRQAAAREDEFMFGPDLRAAPVLEDGARERSLYLPRGRWIDFWGAIAYSAADGSLVPTGLPRRAMRGGRREVTVPAPLDRLPLMVRAGAVLPLLPPEVDTLAAYGEDDPEIVSLADRADRLDLLAFPRGRSSAAMFENERLISRERRGSWTLRIEGDRKRTYRISASLGTLRRALIPRRVSVRGERLAAADWSFDRGSGVVEIEATLRRGPVVVSAG